jgi:hypothetical protein
VRDLVVTILTGARPRLLDRMLGALTWRGDEVIRDAHVEILHNGGDAETTRVIDHYMPALARLASVRVEMLTGPLLSIGDATSRLAESATQSRRRYHLHLEDDWRLDAPDTSWLALAVSILAVHPEVYEVRCREAARRAWATHAVTGAPIAWQDHEGWRSAEAHLSFAPTLRRTNTLAAIFPCEGEKDAMKRAHRAGLRVAAQLVPGVFEHIGDGESLRRRTGCAA